MKTATVRDLRNSYLNIYKWIEAGEEVAISKRGTVVAVLVPQATPPVKRYDWNKSAALRCNKSKLPLLTPEQSAALLGAAQGQW
jgi:antitoxin (DNA-binding transcriptional repressor) of toxin-antitoxin stability system